MGMPFGRLQAVFPLCVPVGIVKAGRTVLKPMPSTMVEAGGAGGARVPYSGGEKLGT